jgi:hypothetical protein
MTKLYKNTVNENEKRQDVLSDGSNIVIDKQLFQELIQDNKELRHFIVEQTKEMTNNFIEYNAEQARTFTEQTNEFKGMLVEQNNKLIELASKPTTTNTVNNTVNKQRYSFNLFLTEKCKDAMDISDFIETLEFGNEQLYYFGEHGYVNGITKILMDGLGKLNIYQRPIHCTDLKREILHVKDNGEWTKDTDNKCIKKLIGTVSYRNTKTLAVWQDHNPECAVSDSLVCKLWFNLTRSSINNSGPQGVRNENEIISNIAKSVYIEKGHALLMK